MFGLDFPSEIEMKITLTIFPIWLLSLQAPPVRFYGIFSADVKVLKIDISINMLWLWRRSCCLWTVTAESLLPNWKSSWSTLNKLKTTFRKSDSCQVQNVVSSMLVYIPSVCNSKREVPSSKSGGVNFSPHADFPSFATFILYMP